MMFQHFWPGSVQYSNFVHFCKLLVYMCEPVTSSDTKVKEDITEIFLDAIDIKDEQIHQTDDKPNSHDNVSNFLHPNARKILPSHSGRRLSIWSYIKEFVGRDLTRITLPITMNEPLSLLHKIPECYGVTQIIPFAIKASDPVDRLEQLAAHFAVSQSSHSYRTFKPFNPLLGETFELQGLEKGILFVTEQVSHHPPKTAYYTQIPGLKGYGYFILKINFNGNSIDAVTDGVFTYEFTGEEGSLKSMITIVPPVSTTRNIMFGNLWTEKHGIVPFIDHTNGHKLMLNFRKKGWFSSRDLFAIDGMIVDKMGKPQRYVYGQWTDEVWSCSPETCDRIKLGLSKRKGSDSRLIGKAIPKLPDANNYYGMPQFSMSLNELREDMNPAPTDTRFRPDLVCLENGDLERASLEKHRLEEKQRAARRTREANGDTWTPLWFDLKTDHISNRDEWRFNFKYLEQNFENCPDIY